MSNYNERNRLHTPGAEYIQARQSACIYQEVILNDN